MATSTIISDNGVTSGTTGLKTAGGDDGTLVLQTTTAGGTATTAVTIDTSQAVTFAQTANLPNTFGFKNRIINGDMRIDQRNAGAAVSTDNSFPIDRFNFRTVGGGVISFQQNSTVPTGSGFVNSLALTVTTADASIAASDNYQLRQNIEGTNVADLGFGSASAKTVTISFWVRSSLTGTFGGNITNSAANRSYVFQYTISAANTWEQKTITIPGDTTGTWLTTTGIGITLTWDLGSGTDFNGTANVWNAANNRRASGNVQLVGTLNATWYVTGVQLEVGSTATSFDYRDYGRELAMCQRYYEIATIPTSTSLFVSYNYAAGTERFNFWQFKQTKRASPTVALGPSASWNGATATIFPSVETVQLYNGSTAFYISGSAGIVGITASSEL